MATPQQYVQTMAQQASPFVPNNGNPNTVYNTTATPFGGQAVNPWQNISAFGGTNIADHWSFAPAPTALPAGAYAAPANQFWNNMTELAPAQFNLDQSGASWPAGDSPFMPVPDTTLPEKPGIDVVVHPRDPISTPKPITGGAGTPNNSNIGGDTYERNTTGNSGPFGTLPLNPNPLGSLPSGSPAWLSDLGNTLSKGWDGLKDSMGFRGDSINAMQVLDWFLPGDLVDANTGSINWDQTAKTALNMLAPGLGSLVESAINNGLLGDRLSEWLNGLQFNRGAIEQSRQQGIAVDEMQQELFSRLGPDLFSSINVPFNVRDIPMGRVTVGNLSNPNNPLPAELQTGNTAIGADPFTGESRDPFGPGAGQAPAGPAPGRSHRAAGATTVAEGAAAQDMYAGMQDFNANFNRLDQIGRALSERMSRQMR